MCDVEIQEKSVNLDRDENCLKEEENYLYCYWSKEYEAYHNTFSAIVTLLNGNIQVLQIETPLITLTITHTYRFTVYVEMSTQASSGRYGPVYICFSVDEYTVLYSRLLPYFALYQSK